MSRNFFVTLLLLGFSAWVNSAIAANFPAEGQTLKFQVGKSLHGDKFEYSMKLDRKTPYYSVYYLEYPGSNGKEYFGNIYAYYYVPNDMTIKTDSRPRPGVVCLHILGGNGALTSMFCANFATNGIPAIMCHMPMFGNRCPGGSRSKMLQRPDACRVFGKALEVSPEDASRTIDIMLTRPEINHDKVNLMGTSLGGIVAATVAARDNRIDKAILLLSGGDLQKVIGYSRETEQMRKLIDSAKPEDQKYLNDILEKVDPLNGATKLQPMADSGRLMMVNAAEDEVIPPDCTARLAEKSGMKTKIQMIPNLGHYSAIAVLPQILPSFVTFFKDDTVPVTAPPAAKVVGDKEIINGIFAQLRQLAQFNPGTDRCILVDAYYKVSDKNQNKIVAEGDVTLLRGNARQFKIIAKADIIPGNIKQLSIGFNSHPWIVSSSGTVYLGSKEDSDGSPAKFLNPLITLYQGMGVSMLDMASKGMLEPLSQWCKIEMRKNADGQRYMSVSIENKHQIDVFVKPNTTIPERIVFDSRKVRGEIVFRHWQLDAPSEPAAFNPPHDAKTVVVKQRELDRMLAAVLNFLVEGV